MELSIFISCASPYSTSCTYTNIHSFADPAPPEYHQLHPDAVRHAREPIEVKRLWKNYYPKKKVTLLAGQAGVNIYQD